jgi:hypothetical protein
MRNGTSAALAFALLACPPGLAAHEDGMYREYRSAYGEHKIESKPGEWKEEHKGPGFEHKYERKDGGWKEEFKDGRCDVQREYTRDGGYKEEVKCR